MSSRPVVSLALARALSSRPGNVKTANILLEAHGFEAYCGEVKHVSVHTLYFIRCRGQDFTIKIKTD